MLMTSLPTGTVTFLFTDVEDSTRLWDADPVAMNEALKRHDRLAEEVIQRHNGHVIVERGEGDSVFAVFSRAQEGVAAAHDLQKAFLTEPWPESAPLRVRMAVHTGECESRGGTYYGSPVNRCARLRGIGHGGQVLLSLTTSQIAGDSLPDGCSLRDLGTHRLKDLLRPERVHELCGTTSQEFPALRSLDRRPHNLPIQWMSFVGREREVGELTELVRGNRLVTITGSGGCGKTRLGLQVAAEALDGFEDGCWVTELAPISHDEGERNPKILWSTLARTLRIPNQEASDDEQLVTRGIGERSLLLLIDNCEHLRIPAARLVFSLLRTCPNVSILSTSRELLDVPGEAAYRVPPLTVPPEPNGRRLKELSGYDSVRLFAERAAARDSHFALTVSNVASVAQICRRLDGIPLAIEHAASHIHTLAPEQLLARLEQTLKAAATSPIDVPAHHVTMRATIDWSYGMLTPMEQLLFERQSVFAGGWSLEMAEAVCAAEGIEPVDVLGLLQSLVRKSMVHADDVGGPEKRYHYLEIIRSYAAEKCAACEVFSARHANAYAELAERADPELIGPDQALWARAIDTEYDNFRAALGWSLSNSPETALRIAHSLRRYWQTRGHHGEGRMWLERALDLGVGDPLCRAQALNALGAIRWRQGELESAEAAFAEGLEIFRASGSLKDQAAVLNNLGIVASLRENLDVAHQMLSESLELARQIGDANVLGVALLNLGMLEMDRGSHDAAAALLHESLETLMRAQNPSKVVSARLNLAESLYFEGDYPTALSQLAQCFNALEENPDDATLAEALLLLSLIASERGTISDAATLLGAAVACFVGSGAVLTRRHLGHKARVEAKGRETASEAYEEREQAGTAMTAMGRSAFAERVCRDLTDALGLP